MDIYQIFMLIAMLLLGGLSLYLRTKAQLTDHVTGLIGEAEAAYRDTTKAGGAKFAWVVDRLFELVPIPLRLIFTRELIGRIVQSTFDTIEYYARLQIDKAVNKITDGQ